MSINSTEMSIQTEDWVAEAARIQIETILAGGDNEKVKAITHAGTNADLAALKIAGLLNRKTDGDKYKELVEKMIQEYEAQLDSKSPELKILNDATKEATEIEI